MRREIGRPKRNPYKENRVTLYLKNTQAKRVYEELKKKNQASEFFTAALIQHFEKINISRAHEMCLVKKRIGLLNIWKDNNIAELEQQIKRINQDFGRSISELQARYEELDAREKEDAACLVKKTEGVGVL